MKANTIKSLAFLFIVFFYSSGLFAQDLNKDQVKQLIESKNFVFKAQSASPVGGMARQLNSDYDFRLMNDSLISYLPYFGRAYTAPMPGQGGLNFSTSKFEYKAVTRKKGGWDVTIYPKDVYDVRQVFLTISEKGFATMQVSSNNRTPISFNGYIVEGK